MKKHIEPGCLCLFMPPQNEVTEVIAIKFVGSFPLSPYDVFPEDTWRIDKHIPWFCSYGTKRSLPLAEEKYLFRIDDYDDSDEQDKEVIDGYSKTKRPVES